MAVEFIAIRSRPSDEKLFVKIASATFYFSLAKWRSKHNYAGMPAPEACWYAALRRFI
jgi:hypothetical protein